MAAGSTGSTFQAEDLLSEEPFLADVNHGKTKDEKPSETVNDPTCKSAFADTGLSSLQGLVFENHRIPLRGQSPHTGSLTQAQTKKCKRPFIGHLVFQTLVSRKHNSIGGSELGSEEMGLGRASAEATACELALTACRHVQGHGPPWVPAKFPAHPGGRDKDSPNLPCPVG